MRRNHTYNFLGSGRSFRYRDNFSGLSNETKGAASYQFLPMDPYVHQLIATVNTYHIILQRYASLLVKNKLVAALIVEEVIQQYSLQIPIIPVAETRNYLRTHTYQLCQQWLDTKGQTLFLRKPKNPT